MEPEPVSESEMNNKRRRTTESAAEGTRESKGAAVKAAEATRREKTETVSVCYAANSLLRSGETAGRETGEKTRPDGSAAATKFCRDGRSRPAR